MKEKSMGQPYCNSAQIVDVPWKLTLLKCDGSCWINCGIRVQKKSMKSLNIHLDCSQQDILDELDGGFSIRWRSDLNDVRLYTTSTLLHN